MVKDWNEGKLKYFSVPPIIYEDDGDMNVD
jgi:hypothetical protein